MLRFRAPMQSLLQRTNYPNTWARQKSIKASTSTDNSNAVNTSADAGMKPSTEQASGKLPPRPPLVKNFFMGVVDKELLAYPEVIAREELAKLQMEVLPIANYFTDELDTHNIDATRQVPPKVLDDMRQLGLYGLNVPREYDGKGWNWSESLIASEEEARCTDVALGLLSHRVIIDLLIEQGTVEQQKRWLPKLGSGSMVATEAIYEQDVPEDGFFGTTAVYEPDTDAWLLNGTKSYIVSGPMPSDAEQLYLVIAETKRPNVQGEGGNATSIFLVDSKTQGIKVGEPQLNFGCRGVPLRSVRFKDVSVPNSSLLGQSYGGNEVAELLSRASRLRNSMLGLSMCKQLLRSVAEYCINTKHYGIALMDMEMTQTHMAKGHCATYAMESMLYMTAGLLDEFERPDVALEAAITKYYTLSRLFKMASKCMDIIGPKSLLSGEPSEIAFRNAAQLCTLGESMDTLRLYIALTGLQFAGSLLQDSVRRSRNPLLHPKHVFDKLLHNTSIEQPKSKMRLGENLHPSLEPAAQCIEHAAVRLHMCAELLLTHYGPQVVERHHQLQRLAEMVTLLYSMYASAARASRSYCIGLPLADYEMLTATAICSHGGDVVKTLALEVQAGHYVNNDNNLQRIVKQVVKSRGYFPVHALTYNF